MWWFSGEDANGAPVTESVGVDSPDLPVIGGVIIKVNITLPRCAGQGVVPTLDDGGISQRRSSG